MASSRRGLLVAAGTVLAGVTGCTETTDEPDGSPSPTEASPGSPSPTDEPTDDLDLREANVTAVEVAETDGGYRFDVTLYHDDDGEDGYADWWQVETLDGDRLGRRDLAHPHGTREFTRSATVDVGAVDCVVVRGHDRTHGYGGRAMLVTPASGAMKAIDQGPEPESLADASCP